MIRTFWKPPYHYTMLLLFLRMSLEIGRRFAPYSIKLLVFSFRFVREGSPKKVAVLLDFFQITSPSPSPQFGQLVQLFLNAKNVDLSYIQNDSLSKILLK